MDNAGYFFAAFAVIWAVFFGYLILLFGRQRKLRKEIESIKDGLKERKGES